MQSSINRFLPTSSEAQTTKVSIIFVRNFPLYFRGSCWSNTYYRWSPTVPRVTGWLTGCRIPRWRGSYNRHGWNRGGCTPNINFDLNNGIGPTISVRKLLPYRLGEVSKSTNQQTNSNKQRYESRLNAKVLMGDDTAIENYLNDLHIFCGMY